MPSKIIIVPICMTAMLLGGCQDGTATDYCAIARPIYPSTADVLTDGTARQILDHDETGERLCHWRHK